MLFSNHTAVLVAVLSILLYGSMRFYATPLFHQLAIRYSSLLGRMAEEQNCTFCGIVKAEDPEKLIYKDEELVAFKDIKPAATHHYLIVPRNHISDAKSLKPADRPLVEKMIAAAENILRERGADMSDIRLGFHWPPFNTVCHLHLHAISPVSEMSMMQSVIFRPGTWWFVSTHFGALFPFFSVATNAVCKINFTQIILVNLTHSVSCNTKEEEQYLETRLK